MSGTQGQDRPERRIVERVAMDVDVRWRHLTRTQAGNLLGDGGQGKETDYAALAGSFSQADLDRTAKAQNLSIKGLKLVGELRTADGAKLEEGWQVLVDVLIPGQALPIRALAVVVWLTPLPQEQAEAGLFFEAVNKEGLERLGAIQARAKRGAP
jgi:hypothetical protein